MGYIFKGCLERKKINKKELFFCLFLSVTSFAGLLFTIIENPIVLISKYLARVDYDTLLHKALSNEMDSVHISAYLFNVTNAERFASGEDHKLKVQEVGPFTYQENRTNEDLEIDLAAGVIRYTPRNRVTFLPEESVGRPEDSIVTLPNIAMLSMASAVSDYGYFARVGFNVLTARLGSNPTVTMRAYDYLWGYDEPLIRLGNQMMPGWINFNILGLFDRLYDKNTTMRIEVSARDEDKFMIKTINGVSGLKQWGYPETRSQCNSFSRAFEGIGYPTELTPDQPLKIYRSILCRFLELEYVGKKTMDYGVEGLNYKITNRTFSNIPDNECLCRKQTCVEGLSDMSPCFYGLPVSLSNAHFLDTNPSLFERIEGMVPDEEKHGSEFTIEQTIGMIMTTKFSVQVNVMVRDVSFNSKIERYSDMIVPVAYFKIVQPRLPEEQISTLKLIHINGPYILLTVRLVLASSSLILLLHSLRLLYCNWIFSRRKVIHIKSDILNVKEMLSTEPLMNR